MKKKLFFKFFVFAVIGALVTMTSCKDYDDDITRIDTGLNGVKSDLTSQLAAIKTEMNSSVDSKVKTVADGLAAEKTELDKLKAELATLKASAAGDAEIAALEKKIADSKTEIMETVITLEAFNNFKASNATQLDTLTLRVIALEENSATKAEMEALEAEIAGKLVALQGQLDALDVRVVALEKSLADLMAKHDEDVEDLIGKIGALRSELDPRITTIETLLEIADGKSGALDKITDELAAQLEKINANAEAIELLRTDLEAELAEQLALIKANEEAINGVAEDLAAKYAELVAADEDLQKQITDNYNELNGKITVNKEAIDALDLRVKGIEDKLPVIEKSIVDLGTELNLRIDSVFKLVSNRLTAITLAPNAYLDGIEAIKFTSLVYRPMEADENSLIPSGMEPDKPYNFSTAAPAEASYKFNPRSFKLKNADYSYVNRTAEVLTSFRSAEVSNFVEIIGEPVYKAVDGTVNFKLRRLNAHSTSTTPLNPEVWAMNGGNGERVENFIALEAKLKAEALAEGETDVVVAAPQELIYDQIYNYENVRIADKKTLITSGDDAHYPVTFNEAAGTNGDGEIWYFEMTYDKVFNLKEKVATCVFSGNKHEELDIDAFQLKYKFSVASSAYNITTGSTTTNQQDYIELVDADAGTFKAQDFNKEAIGRTPILKVELVDLQGNVVRRAFVKVKIGVKRTDDLLVGKSAYDLILGCAGTKAKYELDETFIRENVYRVISNTQGQVSLSHEEFWNMYELDEAKVMKNGLTSQITAPVIKDGAAGVGTATKKIVWEFDHSEIGTVGSGAQLVGTVTVKNKLVSSEFPAYVTFSFTVNVTNPEFTLEKVENAIYWKNNHFVVNIAIPDGPDAPARDAIFRTDLTRAYTKYIVDFGIECVTDYLEVVNTWSNGVKDVDQYGMSDPLDGVKISDGKYITLDKNNDDIEEALNSPGGLQAQIDHVYVLPNGDEVLVNSFMINFVRPVNLNMPSDASVTDAQDDGDIAIFDWAGLLTDWRGEAIYRPDFEFVEVCRSYWDRDFIPEFEYVPGYDKLITPAKLEVEMGTVSFTIGGTSITMYEGTMAWKIEVRSRTEVDTQPGPGTWWVYPNDWTSWITYQSQTGVFETEDAMSTQAEVAQYLETLRLAKLGDVPANVYNPGGGHPRTQYEYRLTVEAVQYDEVTGSTGQQVEYTYVKSINYTPAVYQWIPATWVQKPYVFTDRPSYDGTEEGQRVNEWVWTVTCWDRPNFIPGQYWDFYGPFRRIVVDFDKATTNLEYNGGILPVDVTLEQIGNTVKYVNVGAPIQYEYQIYIPAYIDYGWGRVSTTLTINVSPVQ
jgi:hypothetical protein